MVSSFSKVSMFVSSVCAVKMDNNSSSTYHRYNDVFEPYTKSFVDIPYTTMANQFPDKEFYLLSYGSNGLTQMSERLNIDKNILQQHSYAVRVNDWTRKFFGFSGGWGGAVATVHPQRGAKLFGIVHKISKDIEGFKVAGRKIDMHTLYGCEGTAYGYYRLSKMNEIFDGMTEIFDTDKNRFVKPSLPVWVYDGNDSQDPFEMEGVPCEPTTKYTDAIKRMLTDRQTLMGVANEEPAAAQERQNVPFKDLLCDNKAH